MVFVLQKLSCQISHLSPEQMSCILIGGENLLYLRDMDFFDSFCQFFAACQPQHGLKLSGFAGREGVMADRHINTVAEFQKRKQVFSLMTGLQYKCLVSALSYKLADQKLKILPFCLMNNLIYSVQGRFLLLFRLMLLKLFSLSKVLDIA